ncbi:MAG: hypothetical protein R3B47_12175 [Bacteroidia bacterium]
MPLSDDILIQSTHQSVLGRIGMLLSLKDSNTLWMPEVDQQGDAVLVEGRTDIKLAFDDIPFDENM